MHFMERELEDWFFESPNEFVEAIDCTCGDFYWIGRQVAVPSGVIDLLGICGCFGKYPTLYVVELKAEKLRSSAIGQAVRYGHDIHQAMIEYGDGVHSVRHVCVGVGRIDDAIQYEAEALEVTLFTVEPAFNIRGPWAWSDDKQSRDDEQRRELGRVLAQHVNAVCPPPEARQTTEVADGTES